jgi:dihydropyrimidine dehydrogenase (NAD+) subunit PreA
MPVYISCEFLGVKLKNPFLVASVPSAMSWGFEKAAKAGWAGGSHWPGGVSRTLETWSRGCIPIDISYVDKPPQWWAYQQHQSASEETGSEYLVPPDGLEKAIRKAKESGIAVIANILERQNPKAWGKAAAAAERGGADILELNWSCPGLAGAGRDVVRNPEVRIATLKAVRENSGLPVMVKISAHWDKEILHDLVKGSVEAGANAISLTNTITGLVGVDIETGMPLTTGLGVDGKLRGRMSGISGPAIKPFGLRGVAETRRATNVPISGIGGITKWQDAVEYMLVGAHNVQVGTAVMLYGYRIVKNMIRGLQEYMERKGYKTINDFIGLSTDKYLLGGLPPRQERKQPRKMIVNEDKCTGCGRCLIACEAHTNSGALKIEDSVAKIDHNLCHACHVCKIVCSEEAITIEWDSAVLADSAYLA